MATSTSLKVRKLGYQKMDQWIPLREDLNWHRPEESFQAFQPLLDRLGRRRRSELIHSIGLYYSPQGLILEVTWEVFGEGICETVEEQYFMILNFPTPEVYARQLLGQQIAVLERRQELITV